tara:strand:- start:31 stop:468 length:438 start_codon:yes stop_codon:yes gene_type:complete
MSTIKVDAIQTTGGASEIAIDKLKGVSSASSISVVAEGGTTTTNLQQGLAKFWGYKVSDGSSLADSFNLGSITDTSTGIFSLNFSNNMGNATYVFDCLTGNPADDASATGNNFTGIEASNLTLNVRDNTNLTDITALVSGHGDLA